MADNSDANESDFLFKNQFELQLLDCCENNENEKVDIKFLNCENLINDLYLQETTKTTTTTTTT